MTYLGFVSLFSQHSTLCEPNKCLCVYRACVCIVFFAPFFAQKLYTTHSLWHTHGALFFFNKISILTDLMCFGKCDETHLLGKCHVKLENVICYRFMYGTNTLACNFHTFFPRKIINYAFKAQFVWILLDKIKKRYFYLRIHDIFV